MSSFFLLKYKKKFPTKKVISKIYLNYLTKFSWQKKNFFKLFIYKKYKIFFITSINKNLIKENNEYVYILNGQPVINQKKLSVNFFYENLKNIYKFDKDIYGAWSFIVINKKNSEISIFQNRFSHKPSYYANNESIFLYSSDLRSILLSKILKTSQSIKFRSLYSYCNYKHVYGRGISPINEISQLKFNQNLYFKNKIILKKISDTQGVLKSNSKKTNIDDKLILNKIRSIVKASSIPYKNDANCIALSGGIDSAILAYNLKKVFKKRIDSISIIFDTKNQYNEIENIKILESKFVKTNHRFIFDHSIIQNELERSYNFFDSPIPTVSFFGFYKIFTLAKKLGYKNIFTGYGADAAVCGYYEHYLYNLLDLKVKKKDFLKEKYLWQKKHSTKEFVKNDKVFKSFIKNLNSNYIDDKILFLSDHFERKIKLKNHQSSNEFYTENKLDNFSINSLNTFSIAPSKDTEQTIDLLNGTNILSPFSNVNFLNFFLNLDNSKKIKNSTSKFVLRKIHSKLISKTIFNSKKVGFNMPLNQWINNELNEFFKDNLLSSECLNILDQKKNKIEKIFDENKKDKNHMMLLWQMINYFFWAKKYL